MNMSLVAKSNLLSTRRARRVPMPAVALCVLALCALLMPRQHAPAKAAQPAATRPAKISALTGDKAVAQLQKSGQYHSLMQAVTAARYAVTPVARAANREFFAFNPAQKFSARFQNGGVNLSSSNDNQHFPKRCKYLHRPKRAAPQRRARRGNGI